MIKLVSSGLLMASLFVPVLSSGAATRVSFDENGVMQIDGKKTFVISFSLPPPPGGKTPEGKDAFAELRDAGANFMRIRSLNAKQDFSEEGARSVKAWLDSAAKQGMHCWLTLGELPGIKAGQEQKEKMLRAVI